MCGRQNGRTYITVHLRREGICGTIIGEIYCDKEYYFDIGNVLVAWNWREYFEGFRFSREVTERLARATVLSPLWEEVDRGKMDEDMLLAKFIEMIPAWRRRSERPGKTCTTCWGVMTMRFPGCRS